MDDENLRVGKETNAGSSVDSAATQHPQSEWVSFFMAKTAAPATFIGRLRKGLFRVPREDELISAVDCIQSRGTGFARLLALLQTVGQQHDSVQETIIRLSEMALGKEVFLANRESTGSASYMSAGYQWLANLPKSRLPRAKKDIYLTFVLLGWRKQLLNGDQVVEALGRAFPRSARSSGHRNKDTQLPANPVEILLRNSNPKTNVSGLLELMEAWAEQVKSAQLDVAHAKDELGRVNSERNRLADQCDALAKKNATLQDELSQLARRVQGAESHNADLRTEFQHSLGEVRARLRGLLEGELSRWLENAHDALIAEPPRTKVIQERLEAAMERIRGEAEWLRTLD